MGYVADLWQSAGDTSGGIREESIIRQLHREAEKDGHVFAAPTGPFVFLGSVPAGNLPEDCPVRIRRGPATNRLEGSVEIEEAAVVMRGTVSLPFVSGETEWRDSWRKRLILTYQGTRWLNSIHVLWMTQSKVEYSRQLRGTGCDRQTLARLVYSYGVAFNLQLNTSTFQRTYRVHRVLEKVQPVHVRPSCLTAY